MNNTNEMTIFCWYENGQKKEEGNYKNGKKEGLWTKWNENGKWYEKVNHYVCQLNKQHRNNQ